MSTRNDKGSKISGPYYTDIDDDDDDVIDEHEAEQALGSEHLLSKKNRYKSLDKERAKRSKKPHRDSDWN